ncbi:MAG: NADPH:quinone reductase [Planctomycetaceae bacterium]
MKAAFIKEQGPPDVIQFGELPNPVPTDKQVLVKAGAVAVNPIDTYIRGGLVATKPAFPYVIGCDLAGTIEAVGSGVKNFKPGDRVWGSNQGLLGRAGTFSELVAVDEEWLYPSPSQASDVDLAATALVGITAHLGLFLHADLKPGQRVFVNGGSGGVGSAVVQLAAANGATVVTTAGDAAKVEFCKSIGATAALNYREADFESNLQATVKNEGGFDVWFETLREPNPERTIPLMNTRGRIVLMAGRNARPILPVGPTYVNDLRFIGFAMFNATAAEQSECAAELNRLFAEGRFKANVGKVLPLAEAAEAHRLQEEKTLSGQGSLRGKIVLEP